MTKKAIETTSTRVLVEGPIQRADGIPSYDGHLWSTEDWVGERDVPALERVQGFWRFGIVALADGRFATEGQVYAIRDGVDCYGRRCVYPTREEAIRACAGRLIRKARWARHEKGWPNAISAKDAAGLIAWVRGIVVKESASKSETTIARYSSGIRRATDWIAEQESKLGLGEKGRFEPSYPSVCRAALAKIVEFEAILSGLRKKTEITAPTEIIFLPSNKNAEERIEIEVGEVAPGLWCERTLVQIDRTGYIDTHFGNGDRYWTASEAWTIAIGEVASNLRGRHRQTASVEKARAWLDRVAADRGVDIEGEMERRRIHLQSVLDGYRRRADAAAHEVPLIAETPPGPDDVAETISATPPLAPPKRIYLGTPAAPTATIAVAPNENGRWSQASAVHLGIHGYDDALDVGPTYATEDQAWEAAIRRVHAFLQGIKKTQGRTLEYARGWIDGVAREHGVDLRETTPAVPVQIDMFGAAA